MNKNSSVLLIVEGAKAEINLINKLFKTYDIEVSEKQIYSYKTNIYDLYDRIFKDRLDELEDLDFLLTLKESGYNDKQKDILTYRDYSDILLIFDYEPQDNRFDINKISIMMDYFSESTDNGKLYINYPSIESYKHLKTVPDPDYFNRYYSMEELTILKRSVYKKIVGEESGISDIRKYSKETFNYLIQENIKKAEYIQNKILSHDIKESFSNINDTLLLDAINKDLLEKNLIPVLNTCIIFICEYNISLIL